MSDDVVAQVDEAMGNFKPPPGHVLKISVDKDESGVDVYVAECTCKWLCATREKRSMRFLVFLHRALNRLADIDMDG